MRDIIHKIIKVSIEVQESRIKAIRECGWREGEETLEDILKIAELDGKREAYQTMDNLLSGREAGDDGGGK